MTFPTPTGQAPLPNLTSPAHATYAQEINNYTQILTAYFGSTLGQEWQAFWPGYHAANPHATAYDTVHAFAVEMSGVAVGRSSTAVLNALAKITKQEISGVGASLPSIGSPLSGIAAIGDFFQRLTQPATWTRVGEVALGGILVYAGIRALTHGSTAAGAGARSSVTRPVKKVARRTAKVVVPEARLAGRVAAKRVAPKTTARVAAHRENVAKYGQKKPYKPPVARPGVKREPTVRISHVYHHTTPKKTTPKKTVKKP